ncbi:MAG: hypothetical protein QOG04_2326 [Actinomycetota bacterium]|jgi:S-formylglutathione hydrolase FrmB|nr:hypothetical protein [Actinomycetota bacterium]
MTTPSASSRARFLALGTALSLAFAPSALAQVLSGEPTDLPVLSAETPAGEGTIVPAEPIAPVAKQVDGDISDWVGTASRYGGTAVYSGGEYVYQDHIFDANGPDDGRDTRRTEDQAALQEAAPGTYRIEGLGQADAVGEVVGLTPIDVPIPEEYQTDDTYGDVQDTVYGADLEEVRVAVDADSAYLLVRTTTMTSPTTGILVLADTQPGSTERTIPFGSGLKSSTADVALFLNGSSGAIADLASGAITSLDEGSVVTSTDGYTNAIEARLPLGSVTSPEGLKLAVASGTADGAGTGFSPLQMEPFADGPDEHANVANVGFRFDEPVRIWFEKDQALSLYKQTIDPFFTTIDTSKLMSGVSETYVPGHGYHDRIFISDSTPAVVQEGGQQGRFQHYGVYLPAAYDGTAELPLQWWLHWRGGNAHTAGAVIPKMFKQYGEDLDTIVVSPSARGSSSWYVSRGHVDFLEVWKDVFDTFKADRNRVYVSGHSMGGFGSFLLTVLYPDRFAAGAPASPPVTQGAWTGLDFPGCDTFKYDEYTPCYIEANGSRPRDQHTRKLLDNLRHVPLAIFAGVEDELVMYGGVARQSEQLTTLGYRHRLYSNVVAEHYTPPAMDQWSAVGDYEHRFTRDPNPARVTYRRDMAFERATEEVQAQGLGLNFDFDNAYWMSELTADPSGNALFDGTSLAISEQPYVTVPDTDAPTAAGEAGPYIVSGIQWLDDATKSPAATSNAFTAKLTGATRVRLDLARMAIDTTAPITGTVTTNRAFDLRLDGGWTQLPAVTGAAGQPTLENGVLTIPVASNATITITPVSTAGAI